MSPAPDPNWRMVQDPFRVVLTQPSFDIQKSSIWTSTLFIPIYVGLVSATVAILHIILLTTPLKKYFVTPPSTTLTVLHAESDPPTGFLAEIKANIKSNAGLTIWVYKVLRLIGCLALVAFSVVAAVIASDDTFHTEGKHWGKKHRGRHGRKGHNSKFSDYAWIQIALTAFYMYAGVLALCALVLPKRARRPANNHLSVLLLVAWGVYFYRDVWPLATYTLQPVDPEHWTTWSALAVLTTVGVLIPLLTPFEYVPIDPEHPFKEPNPEQTVSWFNFFCFTFLDPIIYAAAKTDHLKYEQLPPLADYDVAAYQVKTSFPHLDPMKLGKHRHLFWGLLAHFYKEYLILVVLIFFRVVAGFAAPLGINRLLTYIETGGVGAVIRPWVWILWLFLGPLISSTAMQSYVFLNTRNLVRIEAIITQLVFEHSLRIRMKEEAPPTEKQNEGTTVVPTPEPEASAAVTTAGTSAHPTDETTVVGTSANGHSPTASNSKGKDKARKAPSVAPSVTPSTAGKSEKKQENLVGKINNFISTDLGNITDARDLLFMVWYTPLQIAICVWFLYSILGVAAIFGMAVLIISIPIPSWIGTLLNRVQTERMKRTDARVQSITEYMNVLRMIKLFAWEGKVNQRMYEKREDELLWTKKRQFLQLLNMNANYILPLLTMIVTFSSYTLIFKHELTASRVFSSMAVFDMLRDQLHIVLWGASAMIQGKVSLDRLTKFLNDTELLDKYDEERKDVSLRLAAPADPHAVGFHNATFTWAANQPGTPTPGRRNFRLRIDGDLFFHRGVINMIIGPTGCGKTSVLMSLLSEMHFQPAGPDSWYNLPREGGVSFAPQEPWILNETIKHNIVFGSSFDEERYKKVLYQCALETDLGMFEAGDETEVGEKGLTLSGGQKARIALARAIYSHAEIILLDDVLSALDVHTSAWIVTKCLKGDLVKDRTIILVTHNVAMVHPIAGFVVAVGLDGRIASQGTLEQALATDAKLREEIILEKKAITKGEEVVDASVHGPPKKEVKPAAKKLIVAEEIALGRVSWPALKMFLTSLGHTTFWITFISGFLLADLLNVVQTFWLGFWASQYEGHPSGQVNVAYYLTVYGALLLLGTVVYSGAYVVFLFGSLAASRKIHERLMSSILAANLRFLDQTPVGRIISRFTLDIRAVDGPISSMLADFTELTITMIVKLAAVVYMTPVFVIPGLTIGGLGAWFGNLYIKAQLSVKREMTNSRSPVFSHFNAAIAGLPSIRAYGVEETFRTTSLDRIDKYTRCARTFYNLNRWISFRMDLMGALFSAGLAAYLIYVRPSTAANVGFSLTMAIAFSGMILWWVRIGNEFEVSCNSLERIEGYINCDQEPKPTESGKPPAYWPSSGHLVVEKLSAAYSTDADAPQVLHNISFEIKSGERVGVVGRTGSGKSSLTLSLLRLIPTKGSVMYDGLATEHVNLNALRNHMTIIPQQPDLLSGTIRDNLDPFGEYDDAVLNDALRSSGLSNIQIETEEERITLDTSVSSGGGNFSLGQRQIIALARAICRQSKVLILDEATAAIDHSTDSMIQHSIRTELKDVTVITVAHRLRTIGDSDKVMVLDAGKLVEFDSPANLLKKQSGFFKSLVDQSGSGEREELYRMAGVDVAHPTKDAKEEEEHKHHSWFKR